MDSFRRLLGYMGNYRGLVALAVFCNVLTAVFTVVSIPIFQPFFNILFEQTEVVTTAPDRITSMSELEQYGGYKVTEWITTLGRETALLYVCGFILLSFLLKNLFRYLALFFMAPVRNGIIRDLRNELYSHLLHLPLGYFTEERKGNLLSRITGDVQEVESSILNVLEAVWREPFIIVGALAFMIFVSPSLTLFVFGLMVFTGVVIGGLGKRLKRSSGEVQETLGQIVSRTEESLGGLRIIKSFGAEDYQSRRFAELNDSYRYQLTRLLWRRDLSSPLTEFLGIATVAVLLLYGSRQVFGGTMEAGTFIAFIFAFYMVIDPAKNFSKAWYNVQKGLGALERVEAVLDVRNPLVQGVMGLGGEGVKVGVSAGADAGAVNGRGGAAGTEGVRFHQVGFSYTSDGPTVLHDINIHIPTGKVLALAGGSGGGKSTIADLLPRFYDPTTGSISLDGRDLRDYDITTLRARFGIVSQEAILFNDTVYNNIVFGMAGVTPEQVEHAARVANAHDFIVATPAGYQTNIGDRGTKLSGGQRQRLTIARAVLRDPDILILDEATSALDSESERLVQEALQRLMAGRTALVIAHRLSTIQNADQIAVLDHGRIIEQGTHGELLERGGAYRKLVELQEVG
ncbi:Lipid A export ATP-binding/permease protein MsbA [Neolewinella maritima]|uniref:Lipid A export ATP-binding/permease protein MsbA n=1 Tax=Neolewinella maritima TaxID=1383882 RepID=A0ABN8FAM7_9BACT|nr:ABC transporter ATP-binding protein [Neolewinella maritima]CAH1001679.1 Lipid A export ATP-binding/permease protein MsbA [Neolewinella maritima]